MNEKKGINMAQEETPRRKRRRWDTVDAAGTPDPGKAPIAASVAAAGLSAQNIQAALAKAKAAALIQRQIQERMKSMGMVGNVGIAATSVTPVRSAVTAEAPRRQSAAAMNAAAAIAKAAALARSGPGGVGQPAVQVQAQPGMDPFLVAQRQAFYNRPMAKKQVLKVDEQGRLVDEAGHQVKLERPTSLLVNKVKEAEDTPLWATNAAEKVSGVVVEEQEKTASYVDPRIKVGKSERQSRGFNFVKQGKYVKKAQTIRMRQLSREMRKRVQDAMSDGNVESILFARSAAALSAATFGPLPDVEWWDRPFLKENDYDSDFLTSEVNAIMHHPVPIPPPAEAPPPEPMPLILTTKERKKLKRQKKMEDQREKQDLIRFGVIDAPEPKVTLRSMMRVLEQDAIANPSEVEAKVRQQMAERRAKHEAHNEEKKLTPEQRREKKRRKLLENTSIEVFVALFRAGDLRPPQTRFKVDVSTQQYNLTGCAILYEECNLVLVEGGPKGIKKFKRLMLERIKWSDPQKRKATDVDADGDAKSDSDDDDDAARKKKKTVTCACVWEGTMARRKFKNFRFENCMSEAMARKFLSDKNVGHYWDMVRNYRDPSQDF